MPDILTPEARSRHMSRIRGRDTKPELVLRRALHAMGLRYRLHVRALPGTPDMVFPKHRAAVFVHGCFWHGHDCELHRLPGTRTDFWRGKIAGNRSRDDHAMVSLHKAGWRTLTVWECAMRGRGRRAIAEVAEDVGRWLRSDATRGELRGMQPCP